VYGPSGYLSNPSPSPIQAWNGSTCVLIYKNGTSGGAFLTAKHTGGSTSIDINGSGEGTAYNVTARYEHPDYDVALLITDSDVSALPTVTLANAVPDKSGSVIARIAGWGRTLSALGGMPEYPRAERWVRGYSVDRNISDDIKPLNWTVQYNAGVSTSGVGSINDSGGAMFADDSYTLYGIVLSSDYTSQTSGQTAVSIRAWVQSILSNPSAKFITKCYLDTVNLRARIYFNAAVDWISPGSLLYIADHAGTIYKDTGAAYGGASLTGVTFVDIVVESTLEERTGSALQTFDLATGAFSIGGVGNVAVVEGQVLDFPEAGMAGEPIIIPPIVLKLGHNGATFSNTVSVATTEWDIDIVDQATGAIFVADPFGRQLTLVGLTTQSGSTATSNVTVSGSRTFGTNLIEAVYVGDLATGTLFNIQYTDTSVEYDCGTDLTWTNGAASFASTSISNNQCRYRSVTAPYSGIMTITMGGSVTSGVAARCIDTSGNLQGSAVTGTTAISFQATSGFRYIFGHLNTSGGALSVSTAIAMPVGTPTVTGATSTGNGVQTTTGLVLQRAGTDDSSVDYFKITSITGGTLYQNDGSTTIANNAFITYAQGQAGLKFTPDNDTGGSFVVTASRGNGGAQLSASTATATITVDSGGGGPLDNWPAISDLLGLG
jgi:hypothetical protein